MKVEVKRVDTFELRNLLGWDAGDDLIAQHLDCIRSSTAIWLGRADGVEACAIGVIPLGIFSDKAYLWMIHTKICEQHPLRFIRWSRKVMDEAHKVYPTIVGLCKCENESGQAWLKWLGAVFDPRDVKGHFRFTFNG